MKGKKTVKTISLESDFWDRCEQAAFMERRSLTAWVWVQLNTALDRAADIQPAPNYSDPLQRRPGIPSISPDKKKTKEQEEFLRVLEERLNLCRLDERLGRWSHFCLVAGAASVNRWGPLGPEGWVDYDTEEQDGTVITEVIPREYSAAEAQAWLKRKQRNGYALAWAYVSGDCESITERNERRRRDTLRSSDKYAHALPALAEAEEMERGEIAHFGMKAGYIDEAAQDLHLLKALSIRDDSPLYLPPHLLNIYERGKLAGWRPGREFLKSLEWRVEALKLSPPQLDTLIEMEGQLLMLARVPALPKPITEADRGAARLALVAPEPVQASLPQALE